MTDPNSTTVSGVGMKQKRGLIETGDAEQHLETGGISEVVVLTAEEEELEA